VLHRLRFDEQDAASAEALERLAQQERGEAFATFLAVNLQIVQANGLSTPGGRKRLDIPEGHVSERIVGAGTAEREANSFEGAGRTSFPPSASGRALNLVAAYFTAKLTQVAGELWSKVMQLEL
jgi:hypothetical protein